MRLSSIKLAGFKSFVEPTKIPFPDQMTCVVGPNGCGKSNVIDAVRWVLGESSAKNLRGDAMTDVIFNGSTHRKPVSQASVELTFDNTTGKLPGTFAERNQIAIKRVVTRDGQSLYFLNGSKCRRRDITDIFLGTGLGPRSYAIIEQGMISRLIESKPQDLRIFIEEAAGVSKYKERRKETQTRIKSTRDNLERLLDVRQELNNQITKLSAQAEAAGQYRTLKAQERELKAQLAVLRWQTLHTKQIEKAEAIKALDSELEFINTAHSGHEDVLAALENEVNRISELHQDAKQQLHNTQMELARTEQQKLHLQDKLRTIQIQLAQLKQELDEGDLLTETQQERVELLIHELDERNEALHMQSSLLEELSITEQTCKEELSLQDTKFNQAQQTLQEQKQQLQQYQFARQTHEQKKHFLSETQAQLLRQLAQLEQEDPSEKLVNLQQQQHQKTQELAQFQHQSQLLSMSRDEIALQLTKLQAALSDAQQSKQTAQAQLHALDTVLQTAEDGTQALLSQLNVKPGYELVVERALLEFSQLQISQAKQKNSVWPSLQHKQPGSVAELIDDGIFPDFLNHIQYLGEQGARVTDGQWCLAIDKSATLYGTNFELALTNEHSQLAQYQLFRALTKQLPGIIEQVEKLELEIACETQKRTDVDSKIALLKEQVHGLSQWIASNNTRITLTEEEAERFKQRLHTLKAQSEQIAEQTTDIEQQIAVITEQEFELEQRVTDAEESLIVAHGQLTATKNRHQTIERQYQDAKSTYHDLNLALQKAKSDVELASSKYTHLKEAKNQAHERIEVLIEEQSLNAEPLAELDVTIEELLLAHIEQEQRITSLIHELETAKQRLEDRQLSIKSGSQKQQELQNKKQALQLEEQSLLLKAQAALEPLTELNQTLKAVLETLPDDADANKHQAKLTQIAAQLDALGAVNLAAIDEHQEALTRQNYLDEQLNDLTSALDMLENAIKKIDRETKSRFKQTFEQVNADLNELFPKVFGGGSAYLELTSDDMLESGVTIMARPPGKKNSTIHLLSGGEKALTALSLVFSIFRLNPAPFCMLDEVDAPLDDANVGRFCRLVEEMSQSVQFIYISHNKVAMEMAGRLTGVTMAEPGVSRMVAVDIEQAVQMAQM